MSTILFKLNENSKVIQQLLGHRDVKTTITVYNSVNNQYIKTSTDKLNEKINKQMTKLDVIAKDVSSKLSDDDFDEYLKNLILEREKRKQKQSE